MRASGGRQSAGVEIPRQSPSLVVLPVDKLAGRLAGYAAIALLAGWPELA